MVRFLLFSDLHLHSRWNGLPLEHQFLCLDTMLQYANEYSIRYILFSGDFFHTHGKLDTEVVWTYQRFLHKIKEYGLKIYGITGNHDHARKTPEVHALLSLNDYGALLDAKFADLDGIPIVGIPYLNDEALVEKLKKLRVPRDCILLMHQGVRNVELNSKGFVLNESLAPSMIPTQVLHTFVGHYHSHKKINPYFTIPGAMFQHSWQDSVDDRGFLDVKIDREVQIKRIVPPKFNRFQCINYNDFIGDPKDYDLNIKITEVPSPAQAREIQNDYNFGGVLEFEYEAKKETKAETIRSDSFSAKDFFDEYVKSKGLPDEYVRIGKEILF